MEFVRLILKTTKTQAYALLYTATAEQIKKVCEILHNLQLGVFPSSKRVKDLSQRYKSLLKIFTIPPRKTKQKSLIRKYLKHIYDILTQLKKYLLEI